MVTPPASTGMIMINSSPVSSQAQTKIGSLNQVIPGARMLTIVVTILIEAMIEEIPRIWIVKIAKSMPIPACTDSGGYSVQPVLIAVPPPGRCGMIIDVISMIAPNGSNQKLRLLRRGSAISGAPIINGIIQLAIPAAAGITAPNIIIRAWLVNRLL